MVKIHEFSRVECEGERCSAYVKLEADTTYINMILRQSGFLHPDSLFSGQTDERCFNGCDRKRAADSGSVFFVLNEDKRSFFAEWTEKEIC